MTIYVLLENLDCSDNWGTSALVYLSKEQAQATMRQFFEDAMGSFHDDEPESEEHYARCEDDEATIQDGEDFQHWWIEEKELDVQVAVEVQGGMVQNIYANTNVYPDVYDLDVSDFPDEGEQDEADAKADELSELIKSPGWRQVY